MTITLSRVQAAVPTAAIPTAADTRCSDKVRVDRGSCWVSS